MKIELKKGKYFNHGEQYFVEFNYESNEEKDQMYNLFDQALLESYGSKSYRSQEGKPYIVPYLADEFGQVTTTDTGRIGGTNIPEDLLPEFIRRFVEADGATVTIGDSQIKGKFDYDEFDEAISALDLQVELKKGEYFNYGEQYFVEFNYGSKEQQDRIYELFDQKLIESYGSKSFRSQEGKPYIVPYLADELGQITTTNTGRIGGTNIPEDLLPEFIRRFVEADGATVTVGDSKIKGKFDYDEFTDAVSNLGSLESEKPKKR